MKNLFTRLMLVAVAALSIVACQTEPEIYVPEVNTFDMTIIAEGDTRTELVDGTSINWSAGDQLSVVVNNSIKTSSALDSATTTASFTVGGVETSESGYTIQAVYPADANKEARGANYPYVYKIETATKQTPSTTSFDGAADMLVAKEVTTTEQPSELSMQFTRLVALGEMTLTRFAPESAIKSVTFSTSDAALTGRSYVNLSTTEVEYGYANQAFKNVVLNYVDTEDWSKGYTIYFTCFPAELTTGFTVVVETTDGTKYTKTVTLTDGKTLSFTAGDMTRFMVKMDDAEVKEPSALTTYNLLTDVSDLTAGDKIIIAAANSDVALSTTQNGNNRGQTAITKSDDTVSFNDDVQILTVEAGTKAETFAFNTGNGYLYAASSSSNYLRTETTLSDNSSWTISVDGGVATIKAQGTNTRNLLRYNSGSSMFSCYASGQQDVAIYYLNGVEPHYLTVSTNTISFTAEGGVETFTVSKNFVAEVSVTCDNSLFTITPGENDSYTVAASTNETTEEITGNITVTAGEFTKTIAVTQEAVPVEAEEITIAEFIEKADTASEYKLTGTISNVVDTNYGNFNLTDASGTIYVYGLYSPEGVSKYWSTAGVKAGDVITIQGTYKLYNTTKEVVNAKYVSHYGVTADKTSVFLAAEGSSESVILTLINTNETISVEHNDKFTVTLNSNTLTISADANNTGATISDTITVKVGDAYTEFAVSQAAQSTGEEASSWTLVADVSTLAVDDQVVLVASNADYALSTNQKTNNRGAAAITKSGETVTFGDDVQILTLQAGTVDGTFAFYTGSGYLYAASSSSNHLKTQTTNNGNSSWKITITDGKASIVAQGANTRNVMQYNPNNGSPLFACYSSASQTAIAIYKLAK